jgi:hypothetical protein
LQFTQIKRFFSLIFTLRCRKLKLLQLFHRRCSCYRRKIIAVAVVTSDELIPVATPGDKFIIRNTMTPAITYQQCHLQKL